MNKKTFLPVALLSLLAIGLVSAGLVEYFGQRTTTIDVELPIAVTGDGEDVVDGTQFGGSQVVGDSMSVENKADFAVDIEITSNNNPAEVGVSHVSTLNLAQKIVDFSADVWQIDPNGDSATVRYTLVDNNFRAEVINGAKEGYVLIYYKDNSDRFNNPATAIMVEDVVGNLPYENDGNADEYNYCATGEYDTCHGAKLWYVPETAVDVNGNINWGMASQFLYETELIQFNDAGVLTIFPGSLLTFNPVFDLDLMLEGTVVITTTIDLFE